MSEKTGALDWDEEVSEENAECNCGSEDFVVLQDGTYPFKVVKFERKEFKGSEKLPACHEVDVGLIFDGGDKGKSYVTKRFYMHTQTLGMIYDFLTVVGLHKKGEGAGVIPWSKVEKGVGELCGSAKLKSRTYEFKGEKVTSNEVKGWVYPKAEPEY